jgi:hypothetical protein
LPRYLVLQKLTIIACINRRHDKSCQGLSRAGLSR